MIRAWLALVMGICMLAGGCAGGPSAEDVLSDTAQHLGEIRSGTLTLSVMLRGQDRAPGGTAGFELRGPFSLEGAGPFPTARLEYTQIAGDRRATVTLVSTGRRAVVEVDGRAYELPDDQAVPLRVALAAVGQDGAQELLPLDDWIEDADLTDGGEVDGTPTDRVQARLDVLAAANGLSALAERAGVSGDVAPAIAGADAELLARSVRSAQLDLRTGKDDRLLRRLAIGIEVAATAPPALEGALGPRVGLRFDLALAIDRVNGPVRIEQPQDVVPFSELPTG